MATPERRITILAPTLFEYLIVRTAVPRARVVHTGMGLSRGERAQGAAIICGLAGGLDEDLSPGTVVIPHAVAAEAGPLRVCDPALVSALTRAARSLGHDPTHVPLVSAQSLVTGEQRRYWLDRGFGACDMETAFLPADLDRIATIRVILDTPAHPIDAEWVAGPRAVLSAGPWRQLGWLAIHAPRFMVRAARIVDAALPLAESTGRPLPVQ